MPRARTSRCSSRIVTRARGSNGTVIVEWVNVTSGYNNNALLEASAEHLMRQGYAFVGVSAQQVGIRAGSSPGAPGGADVAEFGMPDNARG